MRQFTSEELLRELKRRGARRLRRVSLRQNRSTIWSLTQNASALNLHAAYASAPEEVLDAFAVIARQLGRNTAGVRAAREVVQEWPGITKALQQTHSEDVARRRLQALCGDGGDATHCCGTPEQRAYLRAVYRYFNETRFSGALPDDIPVRLSNRMRSSLGHMLPGHGEGEERYVAEIALNVDLMLSANGPERVDTLLHEMAHAADYLFDGNRGHGATWRAWAKSVGCRPDRQYHRPVARRRRRSDAVTRVPPLPTPLRPAGVV